MSKNKSDTGFPGMISDLLKRVDELSRSYWRGRHRVVPLTNQRVITELNLDNQSTLTWTDLDLTSYTGSGASDISEGAFALIIEVRVRDSGSATTEANVQFRKDGSTDDPGQLVAGTHHINDGWRYTQGIVGMDDLGIEYALVASGAGTLDLDVWIIGYIELLT